MKATRTLRWAVTVGFIQRSPVKPSRSRAGRSPVSRQEEKVAVWEGQWQCGETLIPRHTAFRMETAQTRGLLTKSRVLKSLGTQPDLAGYLSVELSGSDQLPAQVGDGRKIRGSMHVAPWKTSYSFSIRAESTQDPVTSYLSSQMSA